jgi:cation diffusion facilitator family transporter
MTLCDISPMINITARVIEQAGLSIQMQPFVRMYSLLSAQKKGKIMTPVHQEELDHEHEHHGHAHHHSGHHHGHDGHTHHHGEHHHHEHQHHHEHHDHDHGHTHNWWENIASALHLPGYGHSHNHADLVQQVSTENNDLAIRTVWLALLALGVTTVIQIVIVIASGSVALLADTVHNLGDSLNSIPLLIAFYLARRPANKHYTYGYNRAEDIAGIFIVLSIGFSAAYILWESFQKLINPQPLDNLGWVAAAAIAGFIGNELVGLMQIRVGRQIGSEAMVADGLHARTDGFTSLAVLIAVIGTWLGFPILDPIVGIFIGVIIVFITRDAALAVWHRLMDAVDPRIVEKAEKVIREHEEVKGLPKLQMRWLGHQLYVELMLALDNKLTIAESEVITDHISHHLYHTLPNLAQATISIVPHGSSYQHESTHHRSA